MKPSNWTHLPRPKQLQLAHELFISARGKLVVSQALAYGIEVLKAFPADRQETSNIEDMEMLHETIFDQFELGSRRPIQDLPLGGLRDRDVA